MFSRMKNQSRSVMRRYWSRKTIPSFALRSFCGSKALGYSVVAAVNGNDALLKLRANPAIDMLFTDIVMPGGMNGWVLADKAREIRPGLPVVYSSGYALEMLAQQGRAPAQSIILVKPYRKVELAERLREALTAKIMVS
jgi:CheY-like chemotaxis protein